MEDARDKIQSGLMSMMTDIGRFYGLKTGRTVDDFIDSVEGASVRYVELIKIRENGERV